MKKSAVFLFLLCLPMLARAQTISGTITASGCLQVNVYGKGVVGIVVTNSGTAWSGTIQPQVIVENDPNGTTGNVQVTPYSSSTAQATITANGSFTASVVGATYFQVCGNTVTNTAAIKLTAIPLAANRNAGTGNGTVTSVAGTANQVDVATGTTTPVVSLDAAITLPGTINKLTLTAPATGSTLTIPDGTTATMPNVSRTVVGSVAGDGVIVSSTPATASAAGLASLTLANAAAGSLLSNSTASAAAPGYSQAPTLGAVGGTTGAVTYMGTTSGSQTAGCSTATCIAFGGSATSALFKNYFTNSNCAVNSASPAACGAAASGAVVIPTTTATYTINTTSVNAASRISLTWLTFASNLPSAPTCVAPATTSMPSISAISAGVSFTIALTSTTGQTCPMFTIMN
ncbi:MAG: hypothetical protein JWQ87_2249 [Candidatus Sulfotelmatobacter sp.]|nr:hypothetical protein [Candidatus Sulfotelmatobacter sp.]